MPVANILSQITDWITEEIGSYGLYAVFVLMLVDAVLPAASEVVMVYAGAVASGALAGQTVTLFGYEFSSGFPAYLAMALAGTVGYVIGSIGGWAIGVRGGRPFLERFGRWFHLDNAKVDRAEVWFDRWGDHAVFVGRITPVVRSFISIPAGVFGASLTRYVVLTTIGSALWCFAFAGAGWAAGESWETFHDRFKLVDYAIAALVVAAAGIVVWQVVRRRAPR
jgi:membrane protein DedA with SNARE-associated domain